MSREKTDNPKLKVLGKMPAEPQQPRPGPKKTRAETIRACWRHWQGSSGRSCSIAASGVFLQAALLVSTLLLFAPNGEKREFEPMEICHHGMKAVFQKSDRGDLLHESVLRDIKDYQFKFERIVSIEVEDSLNCTVKAKFADGILSL